MRCLVRDPRRLGPQRVRVQIALGDLADPPSFRNALRGVAHSRPPRGGDPRPAAGLDRGAQRHRDLAPGARPPSARASSASCSSPRSARRPHHRARFLRAKALAEQAVADAPAPQSIVFAPSIVYAPGDPWLTLLERLALLPADAGLGARPRPYQPIWAEDVADCVIARCSTRGPDAQRARYRAGGPGDAEPRRHRRASRWRAGPQAPAACTFPLPICAGRCGCSRASCGPRARHLGRGRADGGLADERGRRRGRERPRRRPRPMADGARRGLARAPDGRRVRRSRARAGRPTACAASSWAANASSAPSPPGARSSWTGSGRPGPRRGQRDADRRAGP